MCAETRLRLAQNANREEAQMYAIEYIGLDVHKRTMTYCSKTADGTVVARGTINAHRSELEQWVGQRKVPWKGAMEATLFTAWIYDLLKPHAVELLVGHPAKLRAITTAKKKNDQADADMLADLLRCNLLPVCHMAPPEIRDLRRVLRYRNLLVRQIVRLKNRTAGFLMEVGAEYNKKRLHGKKYFAELLATLTEVPPSLIDLLRYNRGPLEMLETLQRRLLAGLARHPLLRERVELLQTIDGVGQTLALTWALEVGQVERFPTLGDAVSYCGLTSAQRSSAGKEQRGPISKQRNAHLQWMLIEAAQMAPRRYRHLKRIYDRERERGHHNRATLEVARKLVAYLLAVDRSRQPFRSPDAEAPAEGPLRPSPSSVGRRGRFDGPDPDVRNEG